MNEMLHFCIIVAKEVFFFSLPLEFIFISNTENDFGQ